MTELGDSSVGEVTLPTDFSLSADELSEAELADYAGVNRNTCYDNSDWKSGQNKRKLEELLEKTKIELNCKSMQLDALVAKHAETIEDLQERLSTAIHQKKILQARLEGQLRFQRDAANKKQEEVEDKLENILKQQKYLEATNERLHEKCGDVRRTLEDFSLTEEQYLQLKLKNEREIPLRDFIALKIYEESSPLRREAIALQEKNQSLVIEINKLKDTSKTLEEKLETEIGLHSISKSELIKFERKFTDLQSKLKTDDFRLQNYDKLRKEWEDCDEKQKNFSSQLAILQVYANSVTKERDALSSDMAILKQKVSLIEKDKQYFCSEAGNSGNKVLHLEDKIEQLANQLETAKAARETLYEKYVVARDQYKKDYETRLQDELEQLRLKTNLEIDRLKISSQEMYEREYRSIKDARDTAIAERERIATSELNYREKYELTLQELRQFQLNQDTRISDLQNSLKLKSFEVERTCLVHEEAVKNLRTCQLQSENLQSKLQVMTKEFYSLQTNSERRLAEVETELNEKRNRLQVYEKLETELDHVVMSIADNPNEQITEETLYAFGYGANVPTTAKRRLKHSVQLARRVLELERKSGDKENKLIEETEKCKRLAAELKHAEEVLQHAQQPYHCLVESIRMRDEQISKLTKKLESAEKQLQLKGEQLGKVSKSKKQLTQDIDQLLEQKEEVAVLKQLVLNMANTQLSSRGRPNISAQKQRQPFPSALPRKN